jgi:hypothetical protein
MAEDTEYMLTTVDNPFNPFTQYDEWFAYDRFLGYNTNSLLARIVRSSDELSEADQMLAIHIGMDEIVKENVSGVHRKISRQSAIKFQTQIPDPKTDGGEGVAD